MEQRNRNAQIGRRRFAAFAAAVLSFGIVQTVIAADRVPTMRRLVVGDLVQFVGVFGPTLAEVLGGPDPSNYYTLSSSRGEPMALPRERLSLVQSAGTRNAGFTAGDKVERKSDDGAQRSVVVKVNGAWCAVQVEQQDLEWVECRELRRVPNGTEM